MGEPFCHNVTLQRLDVPQPYDGYDVFFSHAPFRQALPLWENIPVIYGEVVDNAIRHPDFLDVTTGALSPEYRIAGRVILPNMPDEGQARLDAVLEITDPEVESLARMGALGLSTGFSAQTDSDTGNRSIIGDVVPNHVLVFRQGACPNCYPRDNGALFLNVRPMETTMDSEKTSDGFDGESKSWLKAIHDKLFNTKPAEVPEVKPMETTETVSKEVFDNTVSEKDAKIAELTQTIAEMKSAEEQRLKDAAWAEMKNTLPQGWLGEKEAETREMFENSKDQFYQKLMAHQHEFPNTAEQKAEGAASCGCPKEAEQLMNTVAEADAKLGYSFME